jgi:deoxyribose-phosphate aldolase
MTNEAILAHIDHTVLKPDTTWAQVSQICEEALRYHTASVCIPSYFVAKAREAYPALKICTVIGFPIGYTPAAAKAAETAAAVENGADEIDMVINVSALKDGEDAVVLEEIKAVRKACAGKILKVIVETCYLSEDEKIRVCKLVTDGGADYIKTSTGFGTAGAVLEDIALFKAHIGQNVKIKAAGGIRTREQMEAFLNAGCDRIGCSAARILFT